MNMPNRRCTSLLAPILLLVLLGCLAGCGAKGDLVRPAADPNASVSG